MRITLTERFQKDLSHLQDIEFSDVLSVILKLPSIVADPHRHMGIGIRKLHSSGIFEARVGLRIRLLFGLDGGHILLHRVGTHDEIRRYIKNL